MDNLPAPYISVVLPVYRSADILPELHRRLSEVLHEVGRTYHLIFVNDASPDHSQVVLTALAAQDTCVHLLQLPINEGQQRATFTGLAHSQSPYVIVMDADLQDPPEAIPDLIQTLQNGGFDAVFAGRRGRYESSERLFTSRLFKWLVHRLTGVPKDAGSYVLMTRRMVERLLAYQEQQPYLVGMVGCTHLPVTSIPVERMVRPRGKSAYTTLMRLRMGLNALIKIIWVWSKDENFR